MRKVVLFGFLFVALVAVMVEAQAEEGSTTGAPATTSNPSEEGKGKSGKADCMKKCNTAKKDCKDKCDKKDKDCKKGCKDPMKSCKQECKKQQKAGKKDKKGKKEGSSEEKD